MRLTPDNNPEPASERGHEPIALQRLLWRSYLKTALIPLFVIELGFLATYWLGANAIYRKNVEAISELSERYLGDIAQRESKTIGADLDAIASHTRLLASQTLSALDSEYLPTPEERSRYEIGPEGGLWTKYDNGTTASYYPSDIKIGTDEINKVWNLFAIDDIMKSIKQSESNITSIYFNSHNSYNRIYPFVDTKKQYPKTIDVRDYNFYYEADAEHNPDRRDVWTDAYVDPAGHGWMVSSIAPVWKADKLEGVVGIDITLTTIIESLLNLKLPWGGYAILIDQNGGIIAMPPEGERDFGLSELTEFHYSEVILSDTFKPESFNINQRTDTETLAVAMRGASSGQAHLNLGGPQLASFAEVPQTGWKLVIIAPSELIFADAEALHDQLEAIGWTMLGILLAFYLIFFTFLVRRASRMSELVAKPVLEVSNLIDQIDERRNAPDFTPSAVQELNQLALQIVKTRTRLFVAEDITIQAMKQLQATNKEMINLTRSMSHEIRTPLSIIDSSAQIMDRKAGSLQESDIRKRVSRVRKNVKTISEMLAQLVSRFDTIAQDPTKEEQRGPADLHSLVENTFREFNSHERLDLSMPDEQFICRNRESALRAGLKEIIDNAVRHSLPNSPISVYIERTSSNYNVTVTNDENEAIDTGTFYLQSKHNDAKNSAVLDGKVGIGRHIARMVIEDVGGSILESQICGKRSVKLTIPLDQPME